jgi:hypothetical protein
MVREFDHGASAGRMDVVDSGSRSLAGASSRPSDRRALLWPLARLSDGNVRG